MSGTLGQGEDPSLPSVERFHKPWMSDLSPHAMSTMDSLNFFQSHPDVVRSVRTHCFSSLAFQVWDTMLTFANEVDYIWPIPWNYKIKWWYLYFRYVTLAANIVYAIMMPHLTSDDAAESTCKAWFLFIVVAAMFSKMQLELMFVIRVYALFDRRRWVLFLLCIVCVIGPTINLIYTIHVMPWMGFGEFCVFVQSPRKGLPYAALSPIAQTILVGLTLIRLFIAVRPGWRRTPLVSLLIREGLVSYIVFVALLMILVAGVLREGMQIISLTIWATAILSACGCRFTINMQRLARKHNLGGRPCSDSDPIITSQITIEMADL